MILQIALDFGLRGPLLWLIISETGVVPAPLCIAGELKFSGSSMLLLGA